MLLQKLQQFLYGRYGGDKFNLFLLILGVLFTLFSRLFWPLLIVGDLLYLFALYRMLSRNIPARQRENRGFLRFWSPIEAWFGLQKRKLRDRKTYRYFRCPNCRQILRAPKGRGKIEVTCQKCRKVFLKKV